jgi:hypothetical protein
LKTKIISLGYYFYFHWEPGSFLKILPPQTLKEKKQGTLSACLGLPIGCMKFLFPKEFVTIFGMG